MLKAGTTQAEVDFFDSDFCQHQSFWKKRKVLFLTDMLFDLHNRTFARQARRVTQECPLHRILVVSVHVPRRERKLRHVFNRLSLTRYKVDFQAADMGSRGKFGNINAVISQVNLKQYDWVTVADDDVALPAHFLDTFIFLSEVMDLTISQLPHKYRSHASFTVNYLK